AGGRRRASPPRRDRPILGQRLRRRLAPSDGRAGARSAALLHTAARPLRGVEARPAGPARPWRSQVARGLAAATDSGRARPRPGLSVDASSFGHVGGGDHPRARARRTRLCLDGRRPRGGRKACPLGSRRYHHQRSAGLYWTDNMKRLCLLFVAGLLVASAPAAADDVQPATIPDGVTIGGVAVGGLTPEAATQTVQYEFNLPLTLLVGTTRVQVTPDVLGATAVIDKAVERALAAQPNQPISLGVSVVSGSIADFVAKLAQRFDRAPLDAKLSLRNLRPWLSPERGGRKLDQRQA